MRSRRIFAREDIEVPADLHVQVEALEDPPAEIAAKGFHITYSTREARKPGIEAESDRAVHCPSWLGGTAFLRNRKQPHSSRPASEVLDDRRRPVRRNDVAFLESSDKPNSTSLARTPTSSTSLRQASIRLFDDGSTYGTSVVHDGRLINVPAGGRRGSSHRFR